MCSSDLAEIVSLDHGLFKIGIPVAALWEHITKKKCVIALMEDNSAACRIVITGRNPSMRHISRTQRIDIAAINEQFNGGHSFS